MAGIAAALAAVLVASTAIAQPYLIRDIHAGPDHLASSNPRELTLVGDVVFLTTGGSLPTELWRSDGTADGTFLVREMRAQQLTVAGGLLYFVGIDQDHGTELWRSDGTPEGTFLVRDINPRGGSGPIALTALGDQLFFLADDGVHGIEVWRSDGTEEGTRMVADLNPGPIGSLVPWNLPLGSLDGIAYFASTGGQARGCGGAMEAKRAPSPWR